MKIIEKESLTMEGFINKQAFSTPSTETIDVYFITDKNGRFETYAIYDGDNWKLINDMEDVVKYANSINQ